MIRIAFLSAIIYNRFTTLMRNIVIVEVPMMELTYHRCGDYLYPNLVLETEDLPPLGKYGLLRRSYLKEHRIAWYKSMLLTGELDQHLVEIDQASDVRMERIVEQLKKCSPAPDKETNQLGWVAHMNALREMAEEIVLRELVFC